MLAASAQSGRLDRQRALTLAVAALDSASKSTARSEWAKSLRHGFEITDTELLAHSDVLVQAMALGPASVVDQFAPRLIKAVDDAALSDVLIVALNAPTKKAIGAALTAAAGRPTPQQETVSAVADLLATHAAGKDRAIATAAQTLLEGWSAAAHLGTGEPAAAEPSTPGERWQATPALWEVPLLELPPATPEAVLDALGVLMRRPLYTVADIDAERFLALAQRLAHSDPSLARETLSSLRDLEVGEVMRLVQRWLTGEREPLGVDLGPLAARTEQSGARLDLVPRLLSTPTWVDMRISPRDLTARLSEYAAAQVPVDEADLWLALTRLDVTLATADDRRALAGVQVGIESASTDLQGIDAAQIVLAYLDDPIVQPATADDPIIKPPSLDPLPNRLIEQNGRRTHLRSQVVFASWTLPSDELEFDLHADSGLRFRQLARRASPMPTPLANRLFEAQHTARPAALLDTREALIEAWQRGLLPPGTVQVDAKPTAIAAKASALLEASESGLASFAWELLDALTRAAADGRNIPAGTVAAIEGLQELLPTAESAISVGIADADVLYLPGVRRIAERSGSSAAVAAARALVQALPAIDAPVSSSAVDLDESWPVEPLTAAVEDGATVVGRSAKDVTGKPIVAVDVELPEVTSTWIRVWSTSSIWHSHTGTVGDVGEVAPDSRSDDKRLVFQWDSETERYVHAAQSWDLPPARTRAPLPVAVIAIVLAGELGATHTKWQHERLSTAIGEGAFTALGVRSAIRALLASGEVNPTRLVTRMEKDPSLIPTLWPVFIEAIRYAGGLQGTGPRWLSGVLGAALGLAPVLAEAARTARIPAEDATWTGLREIAALRGSGAAAKRAQQLLTALGPPSA
ncbi:MAG: DUF6493 family protein [Cumulibacter sp.]